MNRTKSEIRKRIKVANIALSTQQRIAAAEVIFNTIESLPQFKTAKNIALFISLPDEVPTRHTLERWSKAGKNTLLPRVEGSAINFYKASECSLCHGAYNIIEPTPLNNDALVSPSQIELMITPAVAYTKEGARLGRGGGFYDRYLSQASFNSFKIGICYRHQLLDTLPTEEHDQRVDIVITD